MTVSTTQALLELLAKSELLSPAQLAESQEMALLAEDVRAFVRDLIEKGFITRWQAAQLLAGRSSFFLGKYKLIELLGRGGMGGVFVAEHTTMNRRVALKIISKELGRDPAALERFLIEARAGAALDHPNIVHSYSVDNEGERYYMVMEYVEGRDLQRIVEEDGPLDFERAADYIRQAADGLAHAHSRKMIHCDIKPANLIVNPQGVVKILDMGMARLMGHDDEASGEDEKANGHDDKGNGHDDRVLGTVDYLAPEQALGSPDLDHRADIYSLGCTLYFLLTGQPPFPEGTLAQRIMKHQTQEPRSILEVRPAAPRDLVKFCQKMMAKAPEERIQSAAEISQWLAVWHPPKHKLVRAVALEEPETPAESLEPLESLETAVAEVEISKLPAAMASPAKVSPGGHRTQQQQLLLYGGIAGGVVLLLLVVLIVVLVSRGGDTSSASRTDSRNVAAGPTGENGGLSLPHLPAPDPKFDPSKVPDGQAPPPPPGDKTAKPAAKPAVSKPAAKPMAKPAAKPAAKPPRAKPAEKPTAKPPPVKPVVKPAPKPPPTPKRDPLSGLPKVVDLPVLGSGGGDRPFIIGKVFTAPDSSWRLGLHGGDNALPSARQTIRQFVLHEKETAPAKASWGVQLDEMSIDGGAKHNDVATFWREGDTLKFQWAPGAQADSANYLRNCVLEVRADGKTVNLPMAKPKVAEPLVIDLHKGVTRLNIPVDFLPDAAKLRVEITKVDGRQGYLLEPSEPAEPKTPISLSYVRKDRDGNEPEKMEFQIRCNARATALGLELNGNLTTTQAKGPRVKVGLVFKPYSPEMVEKDRKALKSEISGREAKLKALKPGEDRTPLLNRLRELERALWYLEFFDTVHAKTKIHFAIYMVAGEHKTILATSHP